jgi:hypothetical protein
MAVGLVMDFDNFTLQDYDKVCSAVNFPADWPDGLLVHGSSEVGGQLRVTDVWESREKFDAYVRQRLAPGIAEAMGDRAEQPQLREQPLHTFYSRT